MGRRQAHQRHYQQLTEDNMESIFAEGIYLNRVHEKAPAFIITNQSIHVKKAIEWLQTLEHKGVVDEKGYIKLVGKESKKLDTKGLPTRYFEVDTYKKEEPVQPESKNAPTDEPPF